MPTVLRVGGFRIVIFSPPREHGPPHVHVRNAGGEVIIELPGGGRPQSVREARGMRDADVAIAFSIVEQKTELLIRSWREHHA